jgi:hypothetical protein
MARRNSWVMPGNGILSGVTLDGAGGPNEYGSNVENESPWAQAVREAWEKQLRTGADFGEGIVSNQVPLPFADSYGNDSLPWSNAFLNSNRGNRGALSAWPSETTLATAPAHLQGQQPASSSDANIDVSPAPPTVPALFGIPQWPSPGNGDLVPAFISPRLPAAPSDGSADDASDLAGWPTRPAFAGTTAAEGVLPTSVRTWPGQRPGFPPVSPGYDPWLVHKGPARSV